MNKKALLYFILVSFLWGIPYFLIKIGLTELSPIWVAWSRITIGAAILLPLAYFRGSLKRIGPFLKLLVLLGLIEIALPFYLIAQGESFISSSLTSILIALEPVLVIVVSLLLDRSEHVTPHQIVGILTGFLGVAILFGGKGDGTILGITLVVVATLCYAVGAVITKKWLSSVPIEGLVATALSAASIMLLPFVLAKPISSLPSKSVTFAIITLGLLCTAGGFIFFFQLIRLAGSVRATLITYTAPLIAIAAGIVALGETITLPMFIGLLLILIGSSSVLMSKKKLPNLTI